MVKLFRALDLESGGGPWSKSSYIPLSGLVLSSPKFNSLTMFCNSFTCVFEYEYEIECECNLSILVYRLHIIMSHHISPHELSSLPKTNTNSKLRALETSLV